MQDATPSATTDTLDNPPLADLYADFEAASLMPLWTQREDLMPPVPRPQAVPQHWQWDQLRALAARAGELVPVGSGGERRAIALANRGLPGLPYATPTLWAAIQFLGGQEAATSHHHSQGAFRFVLEGEGVWTNVNGDPVAMRRGDLLITPSWAYHEHHNTTDEPMAWLDGLDIPLVAALDAGFFEPGPAQLSTEETPARSRSERLWGFPGLCPPVSPAPGNSPLMAYRWAQTDEALAEQLALEAEGYPVTADHGHAMVRFSNPANGRDALASMRTQMHRLRAGAAVPGQRVAGSAVWQVFAGEGLARIGGTVYTLARGDIFVVPSWTELEITARTELDLFRFSDEPVYEAVGLDRSEPRTGR